MLNALDLPQTETLSIAEYTSGMPTWFSCPYPCGIYLGVFLAKPHRNPYVQFVDQQARLQWICMIYSLHIIAFPRSPLWGNRVW
eukprot:5883007-Pyramimonas_sp.AAC.1